MNRRNFFKVVTGFVAGIFATSVEGKKRSGTRYCGETSTGIDPNSEWAKQKPLTLDMLIKAKEEIDREKLLAAVFGPPRCEPCYDDCPHQRQCYGISRATMTEKEKAEYCVSKPFCKKCIFVKNCLLCDVDYKIFWDTCSKLV